MAPGWWDDRKRYHKPALPIYLRLNFSINLSRTLSCLCISGHNFLVQRMRHNRNRRPYELRICDKCDWHSVQDEEHNLLTVRMNILLAFPPQCKDSLTHLRTFLNQPDMYGVAFFVAECLALFPLFFLVPFWFGFRIFPSCPPEAYIAM